jgi:hypothetical protein
MTLQEFSHGQDPKETWAGLKSRSAATLWHRAVLFFLSERERRRQRRPRLKMIQVAPISHERHRRVADIA